MASKSEHNVYVVELDPDVMGIKRFAAANPDYVDGFPCVYVGMTGLSPEQRFRNHRAGRKANTFVRKHGRQLLPRLYEHYNPLSYDEACEIESRLARLLRNKGYGVWQH